MKGPLEVYHASLTTIINKTKWAHKGCQSHMWDCYHHAFGPKKTNKHPPQRNMRHGRTKGETLGWRVTSWLKIRLVGSGQGNVDGGRKKQGGWGSSQERLAVHGSQSLAWKAWELVTPLLTSLWLLTWILALQRPCPQHVNRNANLLNSMVLSLGLFKSTCPSGTFLGFQKRHCLRPG